VGDVIRTIIAALTGDIGRSIAAAYQARHDAKTEQDRISADLEIARLEQQQANRALGGRLTAWVQCLWAAPFIAYNAKLVVWDKVLGLGATDPLSVSLMDLQLRIVTFYFGGAAAVKVVRALRS
tara:strand:+ start:829 stop:1200 length:372 start_codon:yes stop_codon:yes gene_type:complete